MHIVQSKEVLVALGLAMTLSAASAQEAVPVSTLVGHTNSINTLAFSPDGKLLVSGADDRNVRLWDLNTGKQANILPKFRCYRVAFSPDGSTVAAAGEQWSIKLWQVKGGNKISTLEGHAEKVGSVAFSPDGKTIASGSDDQTVRIWDVTTGKTTATFKCEFPVRYAVFSSNGQTIAAANYNAITLWDIATGKPRLTFPAHTRGIRAFALRPDGKVFASASPGQDEQTKVYRPEIKVWEMDSGKQTATITPPFPDKKLDGIYAMAYSPDGRTIAVAGGGLIAPKAERAIRFYDTMVGKWFAAFEGHTDTVYAIAFSPDGKTVATGGSENSIKLWKAPPTPGDQ